MDRSAEGGANAVVGGQLLRWAELFVLDDEAYEEWH